MEAIRTSPVEIAYGFDARGRQIFRHVGDTERILGMSDRDLNAIREGRFVHNHPPYAEFGETDPRRRAGSFSPTDLVLLYEYRPARLIAVTADRTYVIGARPNGFYLDPDQIRTVYQEIADDIETHFARQAAIGAISREAARARGLLADAVMDRLAMFYDYSWEETPHDAV